MSEASWIRRLGELKTARQFFEEFCTTTRDGERFMKAPDILRALALIQPGQEPKVRRRGSASYSSDKDIPFFSSTRPSWVT